MESVARRCVAPSGRPREMGSLVFMQYNQSAKSGLDRAYSYFVRSDTSDSQLRSGGRRQPFVFSLSPRGTSGEREFRSQSRPSCDLMSNCVLGVPRREETGDQSGLECPVGVASGARPAAFAK